MGSEKEASQIMGNLLFTKIFQTFRISIQHNSLIIAFLGLTIIALAGKVMDISNTVVVANNGNTELQIYLASPEQLSQFIQTNKEAGERQGVFSTLWQFATGKFHDTLNSMFAFNFTAVAAHLAEYSKAVTWAIRHHTVYYIIFIVIKLAVISIAGGAICRSAALQFARGEKPGLTESVRFSSKKFKNFFAAPLVPVAIIIVLGLLIFLLGLIGNIPAIGELIVAIFLPVVLIIGTFITIIAIGAVAGFNLMFPAVAYDGSDSFDAISRSYSYVYARPWRMGFYTAIAAAYGAICYLFVRFFVFLLTWFSHSFLRLGIWVNGDGDINKLDAIWPEPSFTDLGLSNSACNWSQSVSAFLIYLILLAIVGLLVSFVISFYFSANTIIYAALRNKVDNTALEDIYINTDDVKAESDTT